MIPNRYRNDYLGEFVITNTVWSGGKKRQSREWIPNPIENHHLSGRAACIGSSVDKAIFDYTILENHRGGLLGSKKLQTYGVAPIANEMRLDFAVALQFDQLKPLLDNQYYKNNIIYTKSKICLQNPGAFYLIPYCPNFCIEVMPLYLAAFDGHKEIFALGYHNDTESGSSSWQGQIKSLMDAYPSTKFYFVGETTNMPGEWFEAANATALNYREFISYCDV